MDGGRRVADYGSSVMCSACEQSQTIITFASNLSATVRDKPVPSNDFHGHSSRAVNTAAAISIQDNAIDRSPVLLVTDDRFEGFLPRIEFLMIDRIVDWTKSVAQQRFRGSMRQSGDLRESDCTYIPCICWILSKYGKSRRGSS